ncbi:hypothetical protein NL676_017297 [Syzygium grande]|nr:hypothetical protein NL676_017297 [Syzygium grande]
MGNHRVSQKRVELSSTLRFVKDFNFNTRLERRCPYFSDSRMIIGAWIKSDGRIELFKFDRGSTPRIARRLHRQSFYRGRSDRGENGGSQQKCPPAFQFDTGLIIIVRVPTF